MDNHRTRICICYLITSFFISMFIYALISNNLESNRQLRRMQEEVEEISHAMRHGGHDKGGGGKSSHALSATETKQITELVDGILKKRLAGIWDDIYAVKKQLKAAECAAASAKKDCSSVCAKASSQNGTQCERSSQTQAVQQCARVNYACEQLGAKVLQVTAEPLNKPGLISSMLNLDYSSNPPINMLKASMEPGNCFAFKRSEATILIKLAKPVLVDTIELEHISKERSPYDDVSSAPKNFHVYGIINMNDKRESSLGNFEYKNDPKHLKQHFLAKPSHAFECLRFVIESNHGNPNFTCIYRVAVFGKL